MKNAFELMTQAARKSKIAENEKQKSDLKDLPISPREKKAEVRNTKKNELSGSPNESNLSKNSKNNNSIKSPSANCQLKDTSSNAEVLTSPEPQRLSDTDNVSADESSNGEDETNGVSPGRIRRLRKRASRRRSSSEENLSPKRQRTENTFSGRTFCIVDDESILQKKPKRICFTSKQIKSSGNNGGVVPSIFKSLDERRAASKAEKREPVDSNLDSMLKHWPIILPKSIAQTTAKEINRLTGQIIELEENPFPKISIISSDPNRMQELTHFETPHMIPAGNCDILTFPNIKSMNGVINGEDELQSNGKVMITLIDEDQARQEVKKLESKNYSFSIRPMLRRFLLYKACTDKQYLDMFGAKVSEDLLGLEDLTNEFSNWLVSYSVTANQIIEGLKSKGSALDDDQLWLSSEAACIGVVSGPSGIGKTSFVRAVAADLNYKVIEINSAQCRSQKALMSQLRDGVLAQKLATSDNGAKSIILIDDADITLIDDSNFHQAICTIAQMSNKPVVLTIANNQVLSNIRVSSKLFELPFNRTEALQTLLQCICIARRVQIEDSIIENLAKSNNFHRSIIDLQLVLENHALSSSNNLALMYQGSDIITPGSQGMNFFPTMERIGGKIQEKFNHDDCDNDDENDETKTEVDLKIYSSQLDSLAFAYPEKVHALFQNAECSVTSGETQEDSCFFYCPSSNHFCKKLQSTEQLENICCMRELTDIYSQTGSTLKRSKYTEVMPFLGLIGTVDERRRAVLENQDQRKSKRYCPYLDQCNLGFSDELKCWLKDFYSLM